MRRILSGMLLCGLCVLSVGTAFAAMPDEEFFELCHTGTPQQVEEAIKNGADLNAEGEGSLTPLVAGMFNTNREVVTTLINAGAVKNGLGLTPFMLTVGWQNNLEAVNAHIKAGANVNAETKNGATTLMIAAGWQNNPEIITALVKAGAKVNARDSFGATPLIFAARRPNPNAEVISALIKAGADINAKDEWGKRAIDFVKNNTNIVDTDAYRMLEAASK